MTLPDPSRPLKIGTRGSPLAMAQAHEVRDRLARAHGLPAEAFRVVAISTVGDRVQDRSLGELGGKGLFTGDIELALLDGRIDIAVHSMKDMPVAQPAGLVLDCTLPRQDPRDAFVSARYRGLDDLPAGAVIGTSSLRRRAQVLHRRPDLRVVEFRGNVETRLRKLDAGVAAATFLAMAGLNRLRLADAVPLTPVPVEQMLPALAQGAIGVARRAADEMAAARVAAIPAGPTGLRLAAERAFLRGLDGSCQTPIAGLAELDGDELRLRGQILRPDGSAALADDARAPAAEGERLGTEMAARLLARAGSGFFDG
jgi:hydroxymethylbilane synthase